MKKVMGRTDHAFQKRGPEMIVIAKNNMNSHTKIFCEAVL